MNKKLFCRNEDGAAFFSKRKLNTFRFLYEKFVYFTLKLQ